jgi:hypothetical protein
MHIQGVQVIKIYQRYNFGICGWQYRTERIIEEYIWLFLKIYFIIRRCLFEITTLDVLLQEIYSPRFGEYNFDASILMITI